MSDKKITCFAKIYLPTFLQLAIFTTSFQKINKNFNTLFQTRPKIQKNHLIYVGVKKLEL